MLGSGFISSDFAPLFPFVSQYCTDKQQRKNHPQMKTKKKWINHDEILWFSINFLISSFGEENIINECVTMEVAAELIRSQQKHSITMIFRFQTENKSNFIRRKKPFVYTYCLNRPNGLLLFRFFIRNAISIQFLIQPHLLKYEKKRCLLKWFHTLNTSFRSGQMQRKQTSIKTE